MSPSVVIPSFFPGTTSTIMGGVVSSLDEDSSLLLALLGEPVTPSCFIASGVVPPPLWTPTLFFSFSSAVLPEASTRVGPGGCLFAYLAAFANILAPLMVPRGAWDIPKTFGVAGPSWRGLAEVHEVWH